MKSRSAETTNRLRLLGSLAIFILVSLLSSVLSPSNGNLMAQEVSASGNASSGTAAVPDTAAQNAQTPTDRAAGHSYHGEVFDEGPRQAAQLMEGIGRIRFDVTTNNEDARRFVIQGVGQLHGFWYFESERSFRQAAKLDADCAMAYWGMAMSNRSNSRRAKLFIAEAMKRRAKITDRERRYVEALDRYFNAPAEKEEEKKKRAERYVSDLEDIVFQYPHDIEAKAFLCEFLWSARKEIEMTSFLSVESMIDDILNVEPLHSAHHYRIHLWDSKKSERALESAARCGLSAPAIAHMWHMPGHTYSKLHRYHDAVWQQEASARVDHAHMMNARILPDQIHNFAHNNEWCIRNMIKIGRVHDSVNLACNMISMPQHPGVNVISRSGSFKYGRQRLRDVMLAYGLFGELIRFSETPWLNPVDDENDRREQMRAMGIAFASLGRINDANRVRSELQELFDIADAGKRKAGLEAEQAAKAAKESDKVLTKKKETAEKPFAEKLDDLRNVISELDGYLTLAMATTCTDAERSAIASNAAMLLRKNKDGRLGDLLEALVLSGKPDEALKEAEKAVEDHPGEFLPLAERTKLYWRLRQPVQARKSFEEMQSLSSDVDDDLPVNAELTEIALELGIAVPWKTRRVMPSDIGFRPALDTLGPFRWSPVGAPEWTLIDADEQKCSLGDFRGKSVVVLFYLGSGCLHCVEQLKKFSPQLAAFRSAGIEVVAISTDSQKNLRRAEADVEGGIPIRLLADPDLTVFRSYRCFDDFEQQPLHGAFLIDPSGHVRWQDIGFEPFTDVEFLLSESRRLLALPSQSGDSESSMRRSFSSHSR